MRVVPAALARMQRTATVARVGAGVYVGYRRARRRIAALPEPERAAAWDMQHTRAAHTIARTAVRLRGLYVKAAQFIGARADLLPEPYIDALSRLHDRVPPLPYRAIRPALVEAFGAEPEHVFASFERRPVAAASLAQVHRATLPDGRRVAVKVQYPDIDRLVRLDLRNLATALRLVHRLESNADFEPLVRAIGRLVPLELDFINEGRNCEAIAAALAHRGDVLSPRVLWDFTSERVLVTEYVEGLKISDADGIRRAGLDPVAIAERAVDVWGEQVLRLGHFHADPHPGNILVLPDGRLGLIDFGLSARLTPAMRAAMARLVIAATERDPLGVMAVFQAFGFRALDDNPLAYMGLRGNLLGTATDTPESVNQRIARALRHFRMEEVSGEVLLIFRVLGLLSGLSARLGRTGTAMPVWRKFADAPPVIASA